MRIGIDARFLQGPRRGQGQYVYYLIKELLGLGGDNDIVAFYNGSRRGAFAFDTATPRLRQVWSGVPGTFLKHSWSRLHAPKIEALIGDIDVFHEPVNFSFAQYGPIPSGAPMVVTFNGMSDPSTIWDKYDVSKIDGWFRDVARSARLVITISEMAKQDFIRRSGFPGERVRIVHYGVSGQFRPIADRKLLDPVLAKYALTGKRYLFYAGGAEPNKNLGALLAAFSAASKTDGMGGVILVLSGEESDFYRALHGKVSSLGLSHKVAFTGYVAHEELPYLYNGAAAFILPTFNEWFGIPVLEALACGVPVAASKNTGALDAVGDSVATFDPNDTQDIACSIREVITNRELRERMRSEGLERVKGLSWSQTAKKTLAVYKEAVAIG